MLPGSSVIYEVRLELQVAKLWDLRRLNNLRDGGLRPNFPEDGNSGRRQGARGDVTSHRSGAAAERCVDRGPKVGKVRGAQRLTDSARSAGRARRRPDVELRSLCLDEARRHDGDNAGTDTASLMPRRRLVAFTTVHSDRPPVVRTTNSVSSGRPPASNPP